MNHYKQFIRAPIHVLALQLNMTCLYSDPSLWKQAKSLQTSEEQPMVDRCEMLTMYAMTARKIASRRD